MGLIDWLSDPFGQHPEVSTNALDIRATPAGMRSVTPYQPTTDYTRTTAGGTPLGPPPGVLGTATPGGAGGLGGGGNSGQQKTPDEFTLADYLSGIGVPGGISFNAPAAPDLTGAVQDQFAGVLQHLRKGIGKTKKEGRQASRTLGGIYDSMAAYNKTAGQRIAKQGRKTDARIGRVYDNINAQRDQRVENESRALSKRAAELGMRASAPADTAKLNKESAKEHRLATRQEGRARGLAENTAANWSNFAKSGAIGARMEGAQAQQELSQNVADLVFQLRGQIAQTQADKAAALTAAMGQEYGMAMDAAQANMSAQQANASLGQNYMDLMMQQQAAEQAGNAPQSMADLQGDDLIQAILRNEAKQESGINQKDASAALEALGNIIPQIKGAPQYNSTGTDIIPGQYGDVTAQDFYSQVPELAAQAGVSPELVRALMSRQVFEQYFPSGG